MDRARLGRELKAAHEAAKRGRMTDPFVPREVVMGRQGYVLRRRNGEARHGWGEASRAEWFDGYVFVFLAAGKVRREATGLLIPPRAFGSLSDGRKACERMQEWHGAAAEGGDARRMF